MSVSSAKTYWKGTHRCLSPIETVSRLRPHLKEMGITRVANVTGMDTVGIDTVIVSRPNARSLSVSQGKGVDLDSARASGLMESIEQYCAERIALPLRLGRLADLGSGEAVVDTAKLPRFVKPFDDQTRILWIEARDLRTHTKTWVPYEMVHLDFTLPLPEGSGHFLPSSSGLASGNQLLEAIVHGITELIERDATTLFYGLSASEQWQARLNLDTIDDPTCLSLLERYRRAKVDVAVWNTTSDVGVPSFLCLVLDGSPNPWRATGAARGAGCHSDPAIALSRALCEAAQSRVTRIVGSRDDIRPDDFRGVRSGTSIEIARAQILAPEPPPIRFGDIAKRDFATFDEEVAWLCDCLRASGMDQVLVVDLSPNHCPANVVRMLVPGLEPSCEIPSYKPGYRAVQGRP